MIDSGFEYRSRLQYRIKDLEHQLKIFKTGDKYVSMKAIHRKDLRDKDIEIQKLKNELAEANSRIVTVRKNWIEIFEDLEKEHAKEIAQKERKIGLLNDRILLAERQRDNWVEKFREKQVELYQVKTELEEEKEKNMKLMSQINRDYQNSSIPSSSSLNHKKIPNNRVRTGRKPGGQPGHKGHTRKKHIPTNTICIPAPTEYSLNPEYYLTGRIIRKQLVNIRLLTDVDEYITLEYRHIHTRNRVHAAFPEGLVNEVNYGGSIKSFLFLLSSYCNVSVEKSKKLLFELTNGQLDISAGMINGLTKELSKKSISIRDKAFHDLVGAKVLHTDLTSSRVNGKDKQVVVCAAGSDVLYFARDFKGHEAIKNTPVAFFVNTLVHDHDLTFYNYGTRHQECLEHILRYLVGSIENEPDRKWNRQMWELIREMLHFVNCLDPNDNRNPDDIYPDQVAKLENRYDDILLLAREEYAYDPPSKYYQEGLKLSNRLYKFKDSCLLFLHDRDVPHNNNLSERLLRIFKRKLRQSMTFRSFDGFSYFCDSLGVLASLKSTGANLHQSVSTIFDSIG